MLARPLLQAHSVANRRARQARAGIVGIGIAVTSGATLGCYVPHPIESRDALSYRGTASLQSSGAPAPELASQAVRLTLCVPPDPPATIGWKETDEVPPVPPRRSSTLAIVDIGDHCSIHGSLGDNTFVGKPGSTCMLAFSPMQTLSVTDATARLPAATTMFPSHVGRTWTWIAVSRGPESLVLEVGGTVIGADEGARHVLYSFSGGLVSREHAENRCAALLGARVGHKVADPPRVRENTGDHNEHDSENGDEQIRFEP
jgi:hypothetical protein